MCDEGRRAVIARLEVDGPVTVGEQLRYVVVNDGPVPVMLGAAYALDRATDAGWAPAKAPRVFPAWGMRLKQGDRVALPAGLPDPLAPGRYRLRVVLNPDRDPAPGYEWVATADIRSAELSTEFEVLP